MNSIGIIPARYESTRFPGKVLARIKGKTLLQHVYENVSKSKFLDEVFVSTNHQKVKDEALSFGAKAFMTSHKPTSGTERIIETINKFGLKCEIVINVQADEPMIKPFMIDRLVENLKKDKNLNVITFKNRLIDKSEVEDINNVKVVTDKNGFALYFSRLPVPYVRGTKELYHFKHLGIYGYRTDFLLSLSKIPKLKLASLEKLEQLQIIENGFRIKVLETQVKTCGVDTREDLQRVGRVLT